jgi:hypothetical protein
MHRRNPGTPIPSVRAFVSDEADVRVTADGPVLQQQ